MKSALTREKTRRRPTFCLETLEGRTLLSTAMHRPAAIVAEATRPHITPAPIHFLKGHVVGFLAEAGTYVRPGAGITSYAGHGTARPIGAINWGTQHVQIATNTAGTAYTMIDGTGFLWTNQGEQINFTYTGAATVSHGVTRFNLTGTITGGTGRFTAATGPLSAAGTIRGPHLSIDFTMTPSYVL